MNETHYETVDSPAIEALRVELSRHVRELEACRNRISELARAEALLAGENRILEAVARGAALAEILAYMCQLIEEQCEGALCGILLVAHKGTHLEHGAAPSLPQSYNAAIHGRPMSADAGACGRAACNKEQVIISDIASDRNWLDSEWSTLALTHGLRACWSTPILSCSGNVLGTFAIYWREPRSPTGQDQKLIEQNTHLASVAIERRRIEQKLRASESNLTEAIDTIPGLVWSVRPDGEVDFLNQRWREFTGLTLEQARGWGWRSAIHPGDLPGLETYWRSVLASGKPGEIEARLRRYDGTFRWFLFRAVPLYDDAGKLVKWYGQNTDIDDRKRAEEAMRAAKARFEGILEIADDTIISVDSSQRIVLFNQGAERVFGYAQSEVMGRSLDLLIPSRFLGAHIKHIGDFGKTVEVSRVMGQRREVFGRRKSGEEFPAEASISKLDLGGELVFTVILRDITERKKAAEALRASEQLARGQAQALKTTLDALATESDPDRLVGHILSTITEQFDAHSSSVWRRDEASGGIVFDSAFEDGQFVPKTDARFAGLDLSLPMDELRPWTEVFRTGKTSVIEDIRTGAPFPLRDRLLPLGIIAILLVPMYVTGRLEGAIGIRFTRKRTFRDEEIELAQALANQAMLAVQLASLYAQNRQTAVTAERNRMARDIHDTLAQGFTGVIMQMEAAKGAVERNDLAELTGRINRASELARSSLAEARRSVRALRLPSLQAGKLNLAIENLLKRMTDGGGLQAEFHADGSEGLLAADCEETLLRITQEALTNTIKHAQARNFRATLSFGERRTQLQLVDDGRGFDTRAEHDGFGLIGMRERVEQMHGQFVVRSMPGEGTEIVVTLNHPSTHET